jgi:hypothetical protein
MIVLPQTNEVQVGEKLARLVDQCLSFIYLRLDVIVLFPRDDGGREWHSERSHSH